MIDGGAEQFKVRDPAQAAALAGRLGKVGGALSRSSGTPAIERCPKSTPMI